MKRMNAHVVNKALRGLKWLGCAARDLQVTRCGRVALSGALAISLSPDLFAIEMDIRAEFQPDSAPLIVLYDFRRRQFKERLRYMLRQSL